MAVNTQKFLPSSKGGELAKVNKKIISSSSTISLSEKSVKDIGIIRVKVIEIDSILKGTLASEKKKLNEAKKQESSKRREKIEEKLETKPKLKAESGKIKMPSLPRMGFLDWVKNFIGNVILGYFAVRLVDHLPKIIPIVKFLGKATDFVLDIGGKLLDGLITFIDWGYKAVDFSRGLIGKTFGDEALKNFDKLTSEFEKFMNLAIIVGMASADFGMDRLGRKLTGKGAERAAEKGAGTLARRGVGRAATRAAARVGGKGAAKLTAKVGSKVLKAIPFLGAGLAIAEGIMRIKDGDYVGGLLSFGSAIPVAGWAFLALDIAREFMGGQEFDKSVGRAFSGKTGLTDKQVKQKTPHLSGPSFMGVAGGGMTKKRKPRRTIRRTPPKKVKYKRKLAPQKPGEVEATSPGADVGGENKLLGLFPNPLKFLQKATDTMNPFGVIKKAGQNLGESDYFGPILSITSKILLGQKPTQQDYKNVGLGINMLVAKGIDDGKLRGGLAAFAEGGFVDPKTLDAIAQGSDISDWVARSFKDATESNAQKTLREIQENLRLKKEKKDADLKGETPSEQYGEFGEPGISSGEMDLFIRMVYAEAGGEGKVGMALVARSILNRAGLIQSGKVSPGTFMSKSGSINDVITAPKQFSPMTDGRINQKLTESQINQARESIKLSRDPKQLMNMLRSEGFDDSKIKKLMAVTGFRNYSAGAGYDASQVVNEVVYKRHTFNTAGNPGLVVASAKISEYSGEKIGMLKGGGKAMFGETGNVSNSPGWVHGHFQGSDPSSVVRDTSSIVKALLRQGSPVYLNPGVDLIPQKQYSDTEIMQYVEGARRAHTHSGTGSSIDVFVKKGTKVPVPLTNIGPSGSGFGGYGRGGLAGYIQGTKTWIGHLDPSSKYEKGGPTLGRPHMAMLGEKGKEFVIDADSTAAIEGTFPGFLDAINKSKYSDAIKVLSNFAPYESGAEQTVVVVPEIQMGDQSQDYDSSSSSGFFMSGGEDESDPFDILYQGG